MMCFFMRARLLREWDLRDGFIVSVDGDFGATARATTLLKLLNILRGCEEDREDEARQKLAR